jgi:two-component system sensor histidine kinase/response regulator
MDAYLSKPVTAESLGAMVGRWSRPTPRPRPAREPAETDLELLDGSLIAGLRALGPEEFEKLVRLFLADGAARIAGLRTAEANTDAPTMVKLAHSLKGSASTFGAGSLAARCGELHVVALSADLGAAPRLIDSVNAEFVRASAALGAELGLAPAAR